jgi:uncharacterized membrane protein YjjB (DUF3815 family)
MTPKNTLLWIFAFIFTVGIAYYQRKTGPTTPVRGKTEIAGQTVRYKLLRSHDGANDAEILLKNINDGYSGGIQYKRFGTEDEWVTLPMQREGKNIIGYLPHQPPAGKLMYNVWLTDGKNSVSLNEEPVVIRFTGAVPIWVLIPHIIMMFTAMMMSTRTGMEAWARGKNSFKYAWITLVTLFVGGLILGPVVQKFAFGAYWTGWPFGHDLTDNKTLVAFIFWAIAVWRLFRKPENRTWPVVAMIVLLLVYLIPHSMFGSSLDYSSGSVVTGK